MTNARRAIYIDFEGRKNEPPALLGVLHGSTYQLFLLDPALTPLARHRRIPGVRIRVATLDEALAEIVRLANAGRGARRVVAFSEHELTMISTHASTTQAASVAEHYLNVRADFKRWYNRTRPAEAFAGEWTLEQCAAHAGYAWPEDEAFSPADAITRLRMQLQTASRRKAAPTPRCLDLWQRLVEYNRHDCLATRHLTLAVAARCEEERAAQWRAKEEARRARARELKARRQSWRRGQLPLQRQHPARNRAH